MRPYTQGLDSPSLLASSSSASLARIEVRVRAGGIELPGALCLPDGTQSLVLVAHGSGSNRQSPRHVAVADALARGGIGTLLCALLTDAEDADPQLRSDADLLARRVREMTEWALEEELTREYALGYFGAGIGSEAALRAAAEMDGAVRAIVLRGGRHQVNADMLAYLRAPILLIAGGDDPPVVEACRRAYDLLTDAKERELAVIGGATRLFDEPGALDRVCALALDWFGQHL